MSVESLSAQEIIAKAEECYSLGLISQSTLERVTQRAETEPGYTAIMDLPFDWDIEHERKLRRAAGRLEKRRGWRRWLRV